MSPRCAAGGTCFGGVVAYEMARQLRQTGELTELLFLLETWPPRRARPLLDAFRTHSHQLRFIASAVRRNIAAPRQQTFGRAMRALLGAFGTVGEIARHGVYRGDTATMIVDKVTMANERALMRYQLRPYDGRLRSAIAIRRVFTGANARARSRTLAPADYKDVDLPATDSGTMLLPPCVEALARWMGMRIDALDSRDAATGRS